MRSMVYVYLAVRLLACVERGCSIFNNKVLHEDMYPIDILICISAVTRLHRGQNKLFCLRECPNQ
eukprot:scaffold795_cov195-Alexandrium_tamarense.AAC.4